MTQQVFTEAHNGTTVTLHSATESFAVNLASNPSTGYAWHLKHNAAKHDATSNRKPGPFKATSTTLSDKSAPSGMVGAPGRQQLLVAPAKPLQRGAVYTAEFIYARASDTKNAAKQYTLRVVYA